ncbi:MAG: hypothetical protein ACE5D8_06085 [Fidelibacterota bacterium]
MIISQRWMPKGNYNHLLVLLSLLLLYSGCTSGPKPVPETFTTLTAMEAQVDTYSGWIGVHRREVKDLQTIMAPFLEEQMRHDFSFYEKLQPSFEAIVSSYDSVARLGQAQYRLVKQLKRRKNPDVLRPVKGKKITYSDLFMQNDLAIQRFEYLLDYHKGKLIKAFRKENMRMVFLRDQYSSWHEEITLLQNERKALLPSENMLLHDFSRNITDRQQPRKIMLNRLKRINVIQDRLDNLDTVLGEIDRLGVSEINSTVFIAPIGTPPREYENRYKKSVVQYKSLLAKLDKYLPNQ